jgi:hypothetical protein
MKTALKVIKNVVQLTTIYEVYNESIRPVSYRTSDRFHVKQPVIKLHIMAQINLETWKTKFKRSTGLLE